LARDLGDGNNVAKQHPGVVKKLLALAESARKDIGDHDRVGKNMRFFDPQEKRPDVPNTPWVKR
jgi:arylsulfatase